MSFLLDVNLLLACGWSTHAEHGRALAWLNRQNEFYTCTLVELGFIRVSMGPAVRAKFADAIRVLEEIKKRSSAKSIGDDFSATQLPTIFSHAEVTDAYLTASAKSHGLQLATLDMVLIKKTWAAGIAIHPFGSHVS